VSAIFKDLEKLIVLVENVIFWRRFD